MQRVASTIRTAALFDTTHTRVIEQQAAAQFPAHALMRRAGAAVARLALAVAPHAERFWIAAGPGNNGGDGLEAAARLQQQGKAVAVSLLGEPARLPADARDALERAREAGVKIGTDPRSPFEGLRPHDLAIDALLGIGTSRGPAGVLADAVLMINRLACPVLAVDVPSGLLADTGQPVGALCVVAHHTLSLLTLKPGLYTGAGRDHAGCIWFDDLGVPAPAEAPEAWLVGSGVTAMARREYVQHKGSFGDVAIVGGAAGMTGAALLAGRAAAAAGAGKVHVALLDERDWAPGVDAMRPELMFARGWWRAAPERLAAATVVCGCGGGDAVRAALPRLLAVAGRLVLDADALNAIAADATLQTLLRARATRALPTVLTPHPLEAARLLGGSTAEVQTDRLQAAQAIAERLRCVVVLKGSGSVTAAMRLAPHINATGNASLASAGTGDVLAGWLGGVWAQAPSAVSLSELQAMASRAVAEHGAAAEPLRPGAIGASELIERLHRRQREA